MRNVSWKQTGVAGLVVGALLVAVTAPAGAQTVTGQWDFNDPNDGYAATIGSNGYIWYLSVDDQSDEVEFDLATNFGIPAVPGGDSGVMKVPAFNPFNGIEMWPGIDANGGGWYVNNYTIIYDLLIPSDQYGSWCSLWQTNYCNSNDGDFWVRDDGAIGVSGDYHGQILPDTWHRVAFAVNCDPNSAPPTPAVEKYIDGSLVGTTALDGQDGRWTLYTESDGVPTLVFADNSNETIGSYVNSLQIRDYTMNSTEVEALGGVSAAGIPIGGGVAGSWNFDNPAQGLAATVGNDLGFFNPYSYGCLEPNCPQDLSATTEFGTTTDYAEVPDLPDGPAGVMRFDATIPCTGYLFPHGAEANGGGMRVNEYTIIMDVYFTADDYLNPPEGHSADWIALYQTWENNQGDAMLWIRTSDGGLGDDGAYDGTEGWCTAERWLRIVAALSLDPNDNVQLTKYVLYDDDTYSGPVTEIYEETLDDNRALRTAAEAGEDILLMFTDESYETHRGFVSSIQVRDYAMTEAEVIGLGGPRAAGIPGAPGCVGDVDGDGDTDLADLAALLGAYGTSVGDPDYSENADFDNDGDVDLADLAFLLGDYGC
jgi:hypothetical protein